MLGPRLRRGALDKEGAEVVGGVVVARYGENPLKVIKNVKAKIKEIAPGLPKRTLPDGTVSQVKIVPFYDRTELIHEVLGTLKEALTEEILITLFVVFFMLRHFKANILICMNLPLAVLFCFIAMKTTGVQSNIMSLGGIAIAIGSMVDMGVILCENIVRHFEEGGDEEDSLEVIFKASSEVGGAVVTSILILLCSFIPVFGLTGPEGKLFRPLAFTKTYALLGAIFVALTVLPPCAHLLFAKRRFKDWVRYIGGGVLFTGGVLVSLFVWKLFGIAIALWGAYTVGERFLPQKVIRYVSGVASVIGAVVVLYFLTKFWMPLGVDKGVMKNLIVVFGVNMAWMAIVIPFTSGLYKVLLNAFLKQKFLFLAVPTLLVVFGVVVWLGLDRTFSFVPQTLEKLGLPQQKIRSTTLWIKAKHKFPGFGREFMPPFDEGSYLWMPTTMPHASFGEAFDILRKQDIAIKTITEVKEVVGKIGRVDSPLDPAPLSMIETIVTYKPEYIVDKNGRRLRFKYDKEKGEFVRDENGRLIPDPKGRPYRQWRDHIRTPDDIWDEIVKAATMPGSTCAPRLQPIAARIVMLQSGMRAPMGVKVYGPTLQAIEKSAIDIAEALKEVQSVQVDAVVPDQVIGKPYLEIKWDREKIARYGVNIRDVQDVIEMAIGGIRATTTVEGRERYPVRVRYLRELRDSPEALGQIYIPTMMGHKQIPLSQLAEIQFVRGPHVIKSEDTFLVAYVTFDEKPGYAEVDVVEECKRFLEAKIEAGELKLPPGVHYKFAGSYENQLSFMNRLKILMPISLFSIFILLYFHFRSTPISLICFIQIAAAWPGGFVGLWLVGQLWFLNFDVFGVNLRDLLHFRVYNLSVPVWVGFIALFGVAVENAVVTATYIEQIFRERRVASIKDIRDCVIIGGVKRVRPCLMTTATTVLALLPVLTSAGKGADIMIPMALPTIFGLTFALITIFVLPVVYSLFVELMWRFGLGRGRYYLPQETEPAEAS